MGFSRCTVRWGHLSVVGLKDHFDQRAIGKTYGSIRGWTPLHCPSGGQWTESDLERRLVESLAFCRSSYDIFTQAILKREDGHDYSIDVVVQLFRDRADRPTLYFIEVKRVAQLQENQAKYEAKAAAASRWASEFNGAFCFLTDAMMLKGYHTNAQKLRRFNGSVFDEHLVGASDAAIKAGPLTYAAFVTSMKENGLSLPDATEAAEQAVANRFVDCDLTQPLSDASIVRPLPLLQSARPLDPLVALIHSAPDNCEAAINWVSEAR